MKLWLYIGAFVLIMGIIGGVYAKGHSAGYDKRDKTVQQEINDAVQQAEKAEERRWAAAVKAAQEQIKIETVIEEKIRVVEKEIPKIVREVVEIRPECRDYFGISYAGVFNDQVNAANSVQVPEAAPGLVD